MPILALLPISFNYEKPRMPVFRKQIKSFDKGSGTEWKQLGCSYFEFKIRLIRLDFSFQNKNSCIQKETQKSFQ